MQTKRHDDEIELQKPKSIFKPEYISIAENHHRSERLYGGVQIVSPSQTKYRNTDRKIKRGIKRKVSDVSMHRFTADFVKKISRRHAKV